MSVRNVWKHKRRICNLILGLKGLMRKRSRPALYQTRRGKNSYFSINYDRFRSRAREAHKQELHKVQLASQLSFKGFCLSRPSVNACKPEKVFDGNRFRMYLRSPHHLQLYIPLKNVQFLFPYSPISQSRQATEIFARISRCIRCLLGRRCHRC